MAKKRSRWQKVTIKGLQRVHSVAKSVANASCTPFALICGRSRNPRLYQFRHFVESVVLHLFHTTGIDDVHDVIDSDGCFGDVGGYDYLAHTSRCVLENLALVVSRQASVKRECKYRASHRTTKHGNETGYLCCTGHKY